MQQEHVVWHLQRHKIYVLKAVRKENENIKTTSFRTVLSFPVLIIPDFMAIRWEQTSEKYF